MQRVIVTDDCVKKVGRTYQIEDTLWMGLSGSGIEFSFSGKSLVVTVVGGPLAVDPGAEGSYTRVAIYADQERVVDDILNCREKKYVIFDGTREKTAEIRIMKLSESPMSVMGIAPLEIGDMDWLQPTEKKERFIEIIGDSITCGYGVDDEDPLHNFSTATEDVTKSYSHKTVRKLNADYSMVSASGYGIISGYTADPEIRNEAEVLPPYYESMGYSRDCFAGNVVPHSIPWDFGKREPQLIILNLGTNDDSYCQDSEEKQGLYKSEYIAFLEMIRKNNPNAKLLCILGLMGNRLYPVICDAVKLYTEKTGDGNITTLEIPEQDPKEGYAADYHPIEKAHERASEVLTQEIKRIMNWN